MHACKCFFTRQQRRLCKLASPTSSLTGPPQPHLSLHTGWAFHEPWGTAGSQTCPSSGRISSSLACSLSSWRTWPWQFPGPERAGSAGSPRHSTATFETWLQGASATLCSASTTLYTTPTPPASKHSKLLTSISRSKSHLMWRHVPRECAIWTFELSSMLGMRCRNFLESPRGVQR